MKTFLYICGTHSCGKSTQARLLSIYLEEEGLSYKRNSSPRDIIPKEYLYKEVTDLYQSYITFGILSDLLSAEEDIIITDRFLIDNIAYSYLSDKISQTLIDTQCQLLTYFKDNLDLRVFYIPIEFDLVSDGVRFENEQFRYEIDEELLFILDKFKIPYVTIKGTEEERFSTIKENLNLRRKKFFKINY